MKTANWDGPTPTSFTKDKSAVDGIGSCANGIREATVRSELSDLSSQLNSLTDALATLRKRLQPILIDRPLAQGSTDSPSKDPQRCNVAAQVHEAMLQVCVANSIVNEISACLELE